MTISKFNNKHKTFNNKKKFIIKSKIIRKYSKIYRGGATEVPKQRLSDEELQEVLNKFIKILEKEKSIEKCPEIKYKTTKGKEDKSKPNIVYFDLDNSYILEKIKTIPILKYFTDSSDKKYIKINEFYNWINDFSDTKKKYKIYKIKYNNKCYEIDRWKLFFDSDDLIKNFNESKYNDITFEKFYKNIENLKTLEGENEKKVFRIYKTYLHRTKKTIFKYYTR